MPCQTRRSAVATLAMAAVGMACRATSVDSRPAASLDKIAERYVRLTLQLAQHQPSLIESWLGPASWRPGPRRPVSELRAEIVAASAELARLATRNEPDARFLYVQQQLDALFVAARRLSGESMSFAEEARASLGADASAAVDRLEHDATASAEWSVDPARADLEYRLPGRGPLHERYAAFRARHALSPDRVVPTLQAAVDLCRSRVLPHITLPSAENVHLESAAGLGLQGRATYSGDFRTRTAIDTSAPIDLARLVWLVAHETYPGHHVQHVLADRDLVRGQARSERALHPAFGRHLLCAEGAAEAGAALLLDGTAFEDACRSLAPIAGIPAHTVPNLVAVHRAVAAHDLVIASVARSYLDGALGTEAAAEQLTTRAFVGDAHQFLFTIERQRTRLLAYPIGRRLVSAKLSAAPTADRWAQLARISSTLTLV